MESIIVFSVAILAILPDFPQFPPCIDRETEPMTEQTWSWLLVGFELLAIGGMWLVGARKWWGWGMVLASSLPWMVYGLIFSKHGFIVMSSLYILTHSRNLVKWRRAHRAESSENDRDDFTLSAAA